MELDDVIRVKEQYYILSTSSLADDRTRVLKRDEVCAVSDRRGDMEPIGLGVMGLYHEDTRFLSRWVLRLAGERPLLLSSAVREDNAVLAVDLTNSDVRNAGQLMVPRGTLHIARSIFLWDNAQYERLRIVNFSLQPVQITFSLQFAADFADIFEIRGLHRKARGTQLPEEISNDQVVLKYRGLDRVVRRTLVHCSPMPQQISSSKFIVQTSLEPKETKNYDLTVACSCARSHFKPVSFNHDVAARSVIHSSNHSAQEIFVANQAFNDWLSRSKADLNMMLTTTPCGKYPYAGVPWFNTTFGRDGIITAMGVLWINPSVARNVLSYLAATQATKVVPEIEAEPGKIIHETRKSEMAALREVPFGHYYGSVDVTPLFVMLAGAYYRRTADAQFISSIWPNIEAAIRWIDDYGDCDKDGFVEYSRHAVEGLVQQGWKDSNDSVFHHDGSLAQGPIALCEVQGYVYAAKRIASEMASVFGKAQLAAKWSQEARNLRKQFEASFWCEDLSTYAIALDGEKRLCRVRTSNAGHCLFTGIVSRERAARVAQTLMSDDSFSGWGIRTVSSNELRYNAMSYHNGSVWPHDNAVIARGFARYEQKHFTSQIVTGMLDASTFLELHRLPELFCGFTRRPGEGPISYPVACAPQAWAAASAFLLLEACLGITVRASPPTVLFRHSYLPTSLPQIDIRNLQVGSAMVDLSIERTQDSVDLTLLKKTGNVDIVSVK